MRGLFFLFIFLTLQRSLAQVDNSLLAAWDPRSQVLDLAPDFSTDAYNFGLKWRYRPSDLQVSAKFAFNRKWRAPATSDWSENPELTLLKNFRLSQSKVASGWMFEAPMDVKAKTKKFQGGWGPVLILTQSAFNETLSLRQKFVIERKTYGIPEKRSSKKNLTNQYKATLEVIYDLNDHLKLEIESGHIHSLSDDSTVRRDNEVSSLQFRKIFPNKAEWVVGFLTDRVAGEPDSAQLKFFDLTETRGFFSVMVPL